MRFEQLPLTARLTVLFTLIAATVLLGFWAIVVWATERHFVDIDQIYLDDKVHLVEKLLISADSPESLSDAINAMLDSHHGLFAQIWINEQKVFGSKNLVRSLPARPPNFKALIQWTYDGRKVRGYWVAATLPSGAGWQGVTNAQAGRIIVAIDTEHHAYFHTTFRNMLLIYFLAAIVVSGVLGGWAARRGLAPLKTMRETAKSVTAHSLRDRMPADSVPVEFAELARSLNLMLDRLQQDFQRLMDFSSDLAHELRTPLSNLLTQTQVALSRKRDGDAYRDILASNAEELERLSKTISDMLFLAKTENRIDLPSRERILLHDEVRALFDFYEAVAHDKMVSLVLIGQAELSGDRLMIRRAISNLLSNAMRHADPDSQVQVSLSDTLNVVR